METSDLIVPGTVSLLGDQTPAVGKSDGRDCKFKVGFYRRPADKIQPAAEREAQEEQKEHFIQRTAELRKQQLTQHNSKHGNVINMPPEQEKLFQTLKKFPQRSREVDEMNHARQKLGANRFHLLLTPQEEQQRVQAIEKKLAQQQSRQTCSILGYGRSELKSTGVQDNFNSDYSYGTKDLLGRHGTKPVSILQDTGSRTLRTVTTSQIVFSDSVPPASASAAAPRRIRANKNFVSDFDPILHVKKQYGGGSGTTQTTSNTTTNGTRSERLEIQ